MPIAVAGGERGLLDDGPGVRARSEGVPGVLLPKGENGLGVGGVALEANGSVECRPFESSCLKRGDAFHRGRFMSDGLAGVMLRSLVVNDS